MAVIAAVVTQTQRGVVKLQWSNLANGDTGAPEDVSRYPDITVQVQGTFGVGGSISMQGTNDGTNYQILNDSRGEGNAFTLTAADLRQLLEGAIKGLRPNVTAGDGTTSLTVTAICTTPR